MPCEQPKTPTNPDGLAVGEKWFDSEDLRTRTITRLTASQQADCVWDPGTLSMRPRVEVE